MTQAVLNSGDIEQALPACLAGAGQDSPNFSVPAITLPMEGLNGEEADALMRAMEFLCVLIEFHDEVFHKGPASIMEPSGQG